MEQESIMIGDFLEVAKLMCLNISWKFSIVKITMEEWYNPS
jgi:hypothetical protein